MRLGGSADVSEPFPEQPRGMHRRTYLRLRESGPKPFRRLYLGDRGLRYSPHRVGREGMSGPYQSLSFCKTTCFSIPVLAIGPHRDLRSPETRQHHPGHIRRPSR